MSENAVVRARISPQIKSEASEVLSAMGLSVSDAIRITLTRIAKEKALPFSAPVSPHTPNAETLKSMADTANGIGVKQYDNIDNLFSDLGL